VPQAYDIQQRPDVRKGAVDDEYVITWNDWSKGIAGSHENLPGCVYWCDDVDPTKRNRLVGTSYKATQSFTSEAWDANPALFVEFNGTTFLMAGSFVYKLDGQTATEDKNFDDIEANSRINDALVFNNELVVAVNAYELWTRNTSGTWTQSTDSIIASHLTVTPDGKLWRAASSNEVSNVSSTDNPLTGTNWSLGIVVGDDQTVITSLNTYGERLAVSKEDGLYLGDANANFTKVIDVPRHGENGWHTYVQEGASDIYYPHRDGLWLYSNGIAEEVGLQALDLMASEGGVTSGHTPPGVRIINLTSGGGYLWAVTMPSYFSRDNPTGFRKTIDNESSFTDYTSEVTDNDFTTVADLSSLDTAANGDYFYIGYSSKYYGAYLELNTPNTVGAAGITQTTTEYWNGSAWAVFPQTGPFFQSTRGPTSTHLQTSGVFTHGAPSDWAEKAIDGLTDYWVRYNTTAAFSSTGPKISEVRVITDAPKAHVFRGRAREYDDLRKQSIVWEPVFSDTSVTYVDLGASNSVPGIAIHYGQGPFQKAPVLLLAGQQYLVSRVIPQDGQAFALDGQSGFAYFQKHDGGMPTVNKQFLDFTIKGRVIDANHTVDIAYNLNEQTNTWAAPTGGTNINSSPTTATMSNVTGYSIQPYIHIDDFSHDQPTEINSLECRFRVLPTYKNEYTALLEVSSGQSYSIGGRSPEVDVQLTNLEGDQGAANIAIIDPAGRSKTVTVSQVEEMELLQDGLKEPSLLVKVVMAEV
jgi:hypothetical protein